MSRTTPLAVSNLRDAKNPHNEQERRQVNIEKSLLDIDKDPEAQVRKIQRQGTTLIGYDRNAPEALRPPTTRR